MNVEKLNKANELNEEICHIREKIIRIDKTIESEANLLIKDPRHNDIFIDVKYKPIILNLAKSLLETELKKLEKEFQEL